MKHRGSASMKHRGFPACAAAAVALAGVLTACSSASGSSGSAGSPAEIVVGASVPLTGGLAGFGYFEKWGYQHAVDQVNAGGGIAIGGVRHKVKLVVLDDQTNPNTTVTNVEQLITQDHVTALAPGERCDSPRVLAAAGPYAAFQLHLGELGVAADTAECAAFGKALAEVEKDRRHLELHRAHLIDLTGLDRPFVTGELISRTTGSGTPDQVRARLSEIAAEGARGVLYGPMGDDIPRELRAFAETATEARSA